MRALLLSLLVATVTLAGCTDDADPAPVVPESDDPFSLADGDGLRDLRVDLTAEDELPAPSWKVGDWFGHHLFFGAEDTAGSHINTIIVAEGGNQWVLATDDVDVATWEAAWDFPMLGNLGKNDLSATAFGADWNIYKFPMADGDTWTSSIDPLFSGPREVTFTATFNPRIETPSGIRPGFDIVGVNADGVPEIATDYVPEIGWYSKLTLFDTSTEEPEDFVFDIIAMGRGENWTGTYYLNEAESLINWNGALFVNPDDPASSAQSTPPHHESFSMSDGATSLYGVIGGGAMSGHSQFVFVDPAGSVNDDYAVADYSAPSGPQQMFEFIDWPAQPGQWEFGWGGAGVVTWGFAVLFEITEHALIM